MVSFNSTRFSFKIDRLIGNPVPVVPSYCPAGIGTVAAKLKSVPNVAFPPVIASSTLSVELTSPFTNSSGKLPPPASESAAVMVLNSTSAAVAWLTTVIRPISVNPLPELEKDLAVQQQTVLQLQQQVSQQASTTAELERQLTDNRSRWYGSSSVQVYPPFGLSLRFGRDRFWGGSLYYANPRYFGPRFYGHGHRRWHRH